SIDHQELHSFPTRRSSDLNDNADVRLTPLGREIGLVDEDRWRGFEAMRGQLESAMELLRSMRVDGVPGLEHLKRADVSWNDLPRSEEHTSELQSRGHLVCR